MNSNSFSISLSPTHTLNFIHEGEIPKDLKCTVNAFNGDWRLGWFMIAAEKSTGCYDPSFRFWHDIASYYLTHLCHSSQDNETPSYDFVDQEKIFQWVASAPPMQGGEYLSADTLKVLWSELNHWVMEKVAHLGGLQSFLAQYAPQWLQVGRVCFHLAENKKNSDFPFAFLATYSAVKQKNQWLLHHENK